MGHTPLEEHFYGMKEIRLAAGSNGYVPKIRRVDCERQTDLTMMLPAKPPEEMLLRFVPEDLVYLN